MTDWIKQGPDIRCPRCQHVLWRNESSDTVYLRLVDRFRSSASHRILHKCKAQIEFKVSLDVKAA